MKNKVSFEMGGVFLAVAGLLVAQLGFSESCTGEITSKLVPILAAAPGLITTYVARFRKGDVTALGAKK